MSSSTSSLRPRWPRPTSSTLAVAVLFSAATGFEATARQKLRGHAWQQTQGSLQQSTTSGFCIGDLCPPTKTREIWRRNATVGPQAVSLQRIWSHRSSNHPEEQDVAFTLSGAADGSFIGGANALNGDWRMTGLHNGKPLYRKQPDGVMRWESTGEDWAFQKAGRAGVPKWTVAIGAHHRFFNEEDTETPPIDSWIAVGRNLASGTIECLYKAKAKTTMPKLVEDAKESKAKAKAKAETFRRGCAKEIKGNRKLMLMPIVPMYHGSTALESVFMSSPVLTTLCSAGTWQCEARLNFDGEAKCIREDLLPRFSQYWNMSKSVLFEKGPRGMHEKVVREFNELQQEHKNNSELMENLGMKTLHYAYVLMWRPICLSLLSSHASKAIANDPKQFALDELTWLEDLVASHKWLTIRKVPVLVANMGDVMWKVQQSKARLENFLPCLGELDFNYVPKLGTDIFHGNEWKAEGSVQTFGESVDPLACCDYNVESGACSAEGTLLHHLNRSEAERLNRAITYLRVRSS